MRRVLPLLFAFAATGCGATADDGGEPLCDGSGPPSRTASCVVSFTPGDGAGFGMDGLPEIVLGEPRGLGAHQGSTDVLSLGAEGEIVLGFGSAVIHDGEGPDFIVFENAFYVGDDASAPYAEPAEVSVSEDGSVWIPFPCASEVFPYDGCAGWHPVYAGSDGISPFDVERAGGDAFDLADLGLASARFVRLRDRRTTTAAPTAGFDLDAIALLHGDAAP
jgi:hypothetical protein